MSTARTFGEVQPTDVIAFGAALGIPEQATLRQLKRLRIDATRHAAGLLEKCAQSGRIQAGEARLLRQIVHGVIKDSSDALREKE